MKRSLFCFLYVGNIYIPVASCGQREFSIIISRNDGAGGLFVA